MAQGDSIVGICNAGLIALGEDVIASLNDPTKAAILCAAKYDQCRREMLAEYPWPEGKAYAQLAASPTAPLFKWGNAYPLPADFIRMWDIDDGRRANNPTWEVVGGQIYTNEGAPLPLQYVRDLQDPTRFGALLAECLGLKVAVTICDDLTQSATKLDRVSRRLAERMPVAQTTAAQGDGPQFLDDDVWLGARF